LIRVQGAVIDAHGIIALRHCEKRVEARIVLRDLVLKRGVDGLGQIATTDINDILGQGVIHIRRIGACGGRGSTVLLKKALDVDID
jgi:hypothetical protein